MTAPPTYAVPDNWEQLTQEQKDAWSRRVLIEVWRSSKQPDAVVADANQPRVPAGNSDGGRWTSRGGGPAPAMEELHGLAGHWIGEAVNTGRPITVDSAIKDASEAVLDKYLTKAVDPSAVKGLTENDKRALATKVNAQHTADVATLVKLGYDADPTERFGPLLARQAVLRETGVLTPLGTKNKGNAHVFYGKDAINAMEVPEIEALIAHHEGTGKFVDYRNEEIGTTGKEQYDPLYHLAHVLDREYQENVGVLIDKYGYAADQIGHSAASVMKMVAGVSHGFADAAPPLQPAKQGADAEIVKRVDKLFEEYFKNPSAHPGWRGNTVLRNFGN